MLVGKTKAHRSPPAWQQAYRALDHGYARQQCIRNSGVALFPSAIQDFAAAFVRLQQFRHLADYDPLTSFSRSTALQWIEEIQDVISGFHTVSRKDRRAFAVYVLLKHRN